MEPYRIIAPLSGNTARQEDFLTLRNGQNAPLDIQERTFLLRLVKEPRLVAEWIDITTKFCIGGPGVTVVDALRRIAPDMSLADITDEHLEQAITYAAGRVREHIQALEKVYGSKIM